MDISLRANEYMSIKEKYMISPINDSFGSDLCMVLQCNNCEFKRIAFGIKVNFLNSN